MPHQPPEKPRPKDTKARPRSGLRHAELDPAAGITARKPGTSAPQEVNGPLRALVQASPLAIIGLDLDGKVLSWNPAAQRLFGWSAAEVIGRLLPILPEGGAVAELQGLRARVRGKPLTGLELQRRRKDGTLIDISLSTAPLYDVSGNLAGSVGVMEDITPRKRAEEELHQAAEQLEERVEARTAQLKLANRRLLREIEERKEAEAALKESEERFRVLFQTAGSLIILLSPEGRILEFNQEAERITGFSRAEVLGKDALELFTPPEERPRVEAAMARVLAEGSSRSSEAPLKLADGTERLFLWNASLLRDEVTGRPRGILAVGHDISERQAAEAALRDSEQRLRFLTSQLLTAQEGERRRVSRELHDELGQALLVLKLQLSAIKDKLRKDQKSLWQDCQQSLGYLDLVINNVRRLSRDLSPSTLEELGLSLAIKHLLNAFSKHYNIASFDYEPDDIDNLFSLPAQVNIYRIFQESLTNIGKHAGASYIRATIRKQDDRVVFRLEDNGRGFPVEEVVARPAADKGLGLPAMDERVRMLGGTLDIKSQPGDGTKIVFSIPLNGGGNR